MTESAVRPKRCPTCGHVLGAAQRPLTKMQADVLRFVGAAIAREGCAPTLGEIAAAFGLSSLGTVHEHLGQLERKGYIRRESEVARGITVLVPFDEIGSLPLEKR